jgi:hypothetical protein
LHAKRGERVVGERERVEGERKKEAGSSPAVGGGSRKQKYRVVPVHHYKM